MVKFLIIMAVLINVAQASGTKYFIQFGSFKNLQGLERSIGKLPSSLRSHVIVVRSNGWYIPFAYYTSNKKALYSKISSYKRYFPDAHIAHSSYMLKHPIVHNYSKTTRVPKKTYRAYTPPVKRYVQPVTYTQRATPTYQNVRIAPLPIAKTIPLAQKTYVMPSGTYSDSTIKTTTIVPSVVKTNDFSTVEHKQYGSFNKQMLSGQHYYLAYKEVDNNPNLLIKVSFKNHEVTYQPVIGDMKMTKASYLVDGRRLYMFSNAFTREGSFSTLEGHSDNYFLVSSWINGKKLNTLRYYYKLNDAKEYLGIDTSDGLAEVLEDGGFDNFFWEE